MSIMYGGTNGLAAVFTADEWMGIWNRNHPDEPAEDGYSTYEFDEACGVWDDGNCSDFDFETPGSSPDLFEDGFGGFGEALDANPEPYGATANGVIVTFFAPKPPSYFVPAYGSIDELVSDILGSYETFSDTPEDRELVRDHLAWVNIAFFG